MTEPLKQGATRIRVEIETGGKTIAYELNATEDETIPFDFGATRDAHEVPDTVGWRTYVPSENFRIRLEAAGKRVTRTEMEQGERRG
jgi:hypothetical protein